VIKKCSFVAGVAGLSSSNNVLVNICRLAHALGLSLTRLWLELDATAKVAKRRSGSKQFDPCFF
ncbi:MAG: hypothetical protein Q8N13_14180, partial [Acidovorax sp.]|nr:hypothetical protein [Acidovorax sp.]